jgi:carboxypeptidase Q
MSTSRRLRQCVAVVFVCVIAAPAFAASGPEPVDLDMITRIRQEGFRNSKVMEVMSELTDRIGPRVTGSPNMKMANEWTRDKLTEFGLANAHLESWGPFGRGWSLESVSVRMLTPTITQLHAIPKAWSLGTNGAVRAKVVKTKLATKEDLEANKGKLVGVIVLNGDQHDAKPPLEPLFTRFSDDKLHDMYNYEVPQARAFNPQEFARRTAFQKALNQFLQEEKVIAVIDCSRSDNGIFVQGNGSIKKEDPAGVPSLVLAHDQYGRLVRLLDRKVDVELELDIKAKFLEDDLNAYNTVAEIPGADKNKKDEVVMVGAHLDSWHAGTGATDDAAGVAAAMEAMRILKALGVKPRRTIRVGLWAAEEQGLLGSRAYVADHFATRPEPTDPNQKTLPVFMRREGPLSLKPEHAKFSAYFNLDNGTGKIRGIFLQENAGVRPIFEAWLEPFKDLGATTVIMRNTGGTDHQSFDGIGLPGFQFVQDPIEYSTRSHHSNIDVYERIQREDLMQAAVIMASFLYHASMRDEMLPRKPLPDPTKLATMPGFDRPQGINVR